MGKSRLLKRQEATQKTIAKYKGARFDFGDTNVDCGQVMLFHLRALGVKIPKTKLKSYHDARSAKKALKDAYGVTTLAQAADKFCAGRIKPSEAIVGDIIQLPAAEDTQKLGALTIYLGNGLILAFEESVSELVVARMTNAEGAQPIQAWRAIK